MNLNFCGHHIEVCNVRVEQMFQIMFFDNGRRVLLLNGDLWYLLNTIWLLKETNSMFRKLEQTNLGLNKTTFEISYQGLG